LGVLLAVVGGTLFIGASEASAALEFCERASSGRSCARLTVPLDRSGTVPGTVTLRIERQKAKRSTRPPLFLIAGGPGQSATDAFDSETVDRDLGTEARSRDIVVMDLRGTGRSGALDCPTLQRGSTRAADIAACAAKLGPRRDFYSSVDMAQDIDAVREALGAERIALYGTSYGTYVVQVYARSYPSRIDRLVLDSVVGPLGVDPFERASLASVPKVIGKLCGARRCRRILDDPVGDAARLAAQLDRRPLTGYEVNRHGRREPARIDGQGLLELMVANDSIPMFVGSLIPGAVRNALRGDAVPLLRAHATWAASRPPRSPRELSAAAYVATLCSDTLLPWGNATSLADRNAGAATYAAAQPAGAFAPFGVSTALRGDVLNTCRAWPSRSAQIVIPARGPLPDVPALLLAGGMDVRTPVDNARAVAAQMPRAELVTIGNSGHGTMSWDLTGCPSHAVRRFLAGGDSGRCGPGPLFATPYPAPPMSLREVPGVGRPRQTAAAVIYALLDASVSTTGELVARTKNAGPDELLGLIEGQIRTGALRGGSYMLRLRKGVLGFDRAAMIPGVRIDGRLRIGKAGFFGPLRISGPAAARGRLTVRRSVLRGTLGGRRVRLRMGDVVDLFGGPARPAASITRAVRMAREHATLHWPR
jgi:pimeloyl-ACP methyl ester carboxylesterase